VVVLFKATGDAPIMKQTKFKVRDISSHGIIIGVPCFRFEVSQLPLCCDASVCRASCACG
jgi:hypothetical protein